MQLHPRHFGRDLRDKLVAKLMKDVEGTCRSCFYFDFFFTTNNKEPFLIRAFFIILFEQLILFQWSTRVRGGDYRH